MSWAKRNLVFLVLSVAAVALLGASGWYLFSKYQLNEQKHVELKSAYDELAQLATQKPNPGNDKTDNIKIAGQQKTQVTNTLERVRKFFEPIPAIPNSPRVTDQDFATALRITVDRLQREAANASVALPPRYNFSFEAQRQLVRFSPHSLGQLAVQLGEIRAICEVLFNARVNSLDGLRRERVSEDDQKGPPTDYLSEQSVTNELAVVTPYEVTFQCFSGELATVLSGFANNPHGMVVKALNVDSGGSMSALIAGANPEWQAGGGFQVPGMTPPPAPQIRRGGLPVVLDEKQLKVTVTVNIIKLLPPPQTEN